MSSSAEKLIIALDDLDFASSLRVVEQTSRYANTFKVGLSLFAAYGPTIVKEIRALGVEVFLDLKLHDIPMQVKKAIEMVLPLAPRLLTVHALGGAGMLAEAAASARQSSTTVLAVSVLTSIDAQEFASLGFKKSVAEGVFDLTSRAYASGVRGFVCSPLEVKSLREKFGPSCTYVCPGVRGRDAQADDQARTMTAYDAICAGASFLVVGRPITKAGNMAEAAHAINEEISSAIATLV